jgi:hypothetical protein
MKLKPRIGFQYGMVVNPILQGRTWIEGEMMQDDYGQFKRRGLVVHSVTNELVTVRLDIADTYFSIPATTNKEHGYITGNGDTGEFEFRPHTDQSQSPSDYRKQYRKDCK